MSGEVSNRCLVNEKLPPEVLQLVFQENIYAEYPQDLERLLLVCRKWREVALQDSMLWRTFDILIYGPRQIFMWLQHIPKRIKRSSPTSLFDITISVFNDEPDSNWNSDWGDEPDPYEGGDFIAIAKENGWPWSLQERWGMSALLAALAGPGGYLQRRWRRFVIDTFHMKIETMGSILSYPTPNLEEVSLVDFDPALSHRAFPNAPRLRSLTISNINKSFLPDFTNLTKLDYRSNDEKIDTEAISRATHLQILHISNRLPKSSTNPLKLSGLFPSLKELSLIGTITPSSLAEFQAPQLDTIILELVAESLHYIIAQAPGIIVSNLKKLALNSGGPYVRQSLVLIREDLRKLLAEVSDLRWLEVRSGSMAAIVLKLLAEGGVHLLPEGEVILALRGTAAYFGGHKEWRVDPKGRNVLLEIGKKRTTQLRELGKEMGYDVERSWDVIWDKYTSERK